LKEHNFPCKGNRLIPSETPKRRLFTGPKTISSNKIPDMLFILLAAESQPHYFSAKVYQKPKQVAISKNEFPFPLFIH
jgi:hypothetical protein